MTDVKSAVAKTLIKHECLFFVEGADPASLRAAEIARLEKVAFAIRSHAGFRDLARHEYIDFAGYCASISGQRIRLGGPFQSLQAANDFAAIVTPQAAPVIVRQEAMHWLQGGKVVRERVAS
jgi:hypothetical protein